MNLILIGENKIIDLDTQVLYERKQGPGYVPNYAVIFGDNMLTGNEAREFWDTLLAKIAK